jgi:phosphatidylserine/phosphatidylglycerophosphate/cardiolipin synthase-like enzyme
MSEAALRSGATNPYEIEKLVRRGVLVFSRPHLHAKMIIADRKVIVGSANVSNRARRILDEAALITTDRVVLGRATEFLNAICIEPVGSEFLKRCKAIYRPPRVPGHSGQRGERSRFAKLICGL